MASMQQVVRRLSIEATTRGVKEAEQAARGLSKAVDGVAVSSQRAERATQSMEGRLASIQRKYDEQYRAQMELAKVERTLMQAQQQGLVTQQRRLELLSLAAEKHGRAAAAMSDEAAAARTLAAANDSAVKSARDSAAVFEQAAREAEELAAATTRLRAQLDPLGAAQNRYNAELAEYVALADKGAIDTRELAAAQVIAKQRFDATAASIRQQSVAIKAAANDNAQYRRQNLGYQAFDIGQGLAGGINPAMILAQQGPQIAQLYAAQGGLNALWKDAVGILGTLARVAGPWIAAAGAIYGAYKLIASYGVEASMAVDETTRALAEQAAPISTIGSQVAELQKITDDYAKAIRGTAKDQSIATTSIIADSKREFEAKKSLLELELKRQQAAIAVQKSELAMLGNELRTKAATQINTLMDLERRGMADPRIGSVPFVRLSEDITAVQRTIELMTTGPVADKIKEMRANIELSEIATRGLGEALGTTFDESVATSVDRIATKTRKSVDTAANAYRDLIKNAQDRIDQMKLEEQMVGKNGVAADTLRFKLELLQDATDKGRKVDAAKLAVIENLTAAYREQAGALAEARALEELSFERSTIGLSDTDVRIAETLRDIGLDLNSIEGQRIANSIRYTDQLHKQQAQFEDMAGIIGDTIGSALVDVFEGGITSFDEFVDHVTKGFAQLAENNIMALFDLGPNGILAGLGGGQSSDGAANDNFEDKFDTLGRVIGGGVADGAKEGTLAGWGGVLKSLGMGTNNAAMGGTAIGAGLGGFSLGYQSQSPLMGGIGGALSGLGAGASIASAIPALAGSILIPGLGAIVGAIAGVAGAIFGASQERKKERAEAQAQMKTQNAAVTQILQVGAGKGVGEYQKQFMEFEDAGNKLQSLARKAGDPRASEIGDAIDNTFAILNREFLGRFEGFNQALRDGLGKNSPFEQGRTAVLGLRDELKNWIADVEYMSRQSAAGDAETQRRIAETQAAAQAMAIASLTGAKELSAVESEILRLQGAAVGLQSTLEQLGMSSTDAAAAIADGLGKAMEKLRADFMAGVDARFFDANGQSYINDLLDLANQTKAALDDSAALGGLGMERIRETFRLSAQTIANDSNLSATQVAEANRVLAEALAAIGETIPQAIQEVTTALFDRAGLQSKINDASGKGYLNQFGALGTELTGLLGQTNSLADVSLIGQYQVAAARSIAESSGLSSEALRGLATVFPQFGRTILQVADDMDKAAETAQRAEEASAAAAAAAARRAAILGLQPGLLERTQGTAASQDFQLSQLQVGNVGLSGIRNAGSVDAARAQLELFINTIKRTGQSADDITSAGQLAYQVFDQVAQSLEAAQSEADRLAESFQSMAESVSDSLTSFADRATSEMKSAFDQTIDTYRGQYSDLIDSITGAKSYLDSIATLSTNPQTQFEIMQGRFRDAASAASGGDAAALRGLTGQAGSYLDSAAQFFPAGTQQYFQAVEEVRAALGTGIGAAQDRANSITGQMERLNLLMEQQIKVVQDTAASTIAAINQAGAVNEVVMTRLAELLASGKPNEQIVRELKAIVTGLRENADAVKSVRKAA